MGIFASGSLRRTVALAFVAAAIVGLLACGVPATSRNFLAPRGIGADAQRRLQSSAAGSGLWGGGANFAAWLAASDTEGGSADEWLTSARMWAEDFHAGLGQGLGVRANRTTTTGISQHLVRRWHQHGDGANATAAEVSMAMAPTRPPPRFSDQLGNQGLPNVRYLMPLELIIIDVVESVPAGDAYGDRFVSILRNMSNGTMEVDWWVTTAPDVPHELQEMWFFCASANHANATDQEAAREVAWCEEQLDIALDDARWLDLMAQWVADVVAVDDDQMDGSGLANFSGNVTTEHVSSAFMQLGGAVRGFRPRGRR